MSEPHGRAAVEIADPAVQSAPYAAAERIADPGFRAFTTALLAQSGWTIAAGGAADLRIVRSPLVLAGDRPLEVPAGAVPPAGECAIVTPWFDLAVSRGAAAHVRGILHWNERQILRDKAASAGAAVSTGPAVPLPRDDFERWAQSYATALTKPGGRAPAGDLPGEIAWLFRQAPQSTFGPFSMVAEGAAAEIVAPAAGYYARLAQALIGRCATSGEARLVIPDIAAARRLMPE